MAVEAAAASDVDDEMTNNGRSVGGRRESSHSWQLEGRKEGRKGTKVDAAAAGKTTEKAQKVCPGLRDPVTFPALTLWSIKRYIGQTILANPV